MPGERPLPDFLGIGALKAGTSYLDAMLRSHPGLSLPLHLKEVEYFNRHVDRGIEWYRTQFPPDDGRPRGEVSPQYLFDPESPARIATTNPGARLILSVRHPVSRAVSQYRHWVQETGYGGDFATFLAEHPGAVERSRYWALLQRYRALFPDEQLHVVVFEDMVADPLPVLRGVYEFLGVDPTHVPETIGEAVNVSGVPRFPRLYRQGKKVSRALYDHGAGQMVVRLKALRSVSTLRGMARTAAPEPVAVPSDLPACFRDDASALSDYLGRDLVAAWNLQ